MKDEPSPPTESNRAKRLARKRSKDSRPPNLIIGWREWIALPDLGIARIKAKVDSGARSSSLHAFDIEPFTRGGVDWVRFKVHPVQRSDAETVALETQILEMREVRSSSGKATLRPVILTRVTLHNRSWLVELTLANRDKMGFRMLLGRQAFRRKFLVDAGRSWLGGNLPPTNSD